MDCREFLSKVQAHQDLQYIGCDDERFLVYVANKVTKARFEIAVSAIADSDWEQLLAMFLGNREAKIMTHLSRIVGYYALLHNWNKSKIAELNDRHKGQYTLPEVDEHASRPRADSRSPVAAV